MREALISESYDWIKLLEPKKTRDGFIAKYLVLTRRWT